MALLLIAPIVAAPPPQEPQRAVGTVKEGVTAVLVDVVVRDRRGHPIYTGLIVAVFATAAIRATPWALLGAALFALGFALKAKVEERFLEAELGGYDGYRAGCR